MMAGVSIGRSTRRTAPSAVAPRSRAASSYCVPMVSSLALTITTGYDNWKVMSPMSCAVVPSVKGVARVVTRKSSPMARAISGMTNDRSTAKLAPVGTLPRHRSRASANVTPSGTVMMVAMMARVIVWRRALRSAGSLRIDPFGSHVYQRRENPCHTLRDRPALNENRIATATGTSDHSR